MISIIVVCVEIGVGAMGSSRPVTHVRLQHVVPFNLGSMELNSNVLPAAHHQTMLVVFHTFKTPGYSRCFVEHDNSAVCVDFKKHVSAD